MRFAYDSRRAFVDDVCFAKAKHTFKIHYFIKTVGPLGGGVHIYIYIYTYLYIMIGLRAAAHPGVHGRRGGDAAAGLRSLFGRARA